MSQRYPRGMDLIARGECPRRAVHGAACMFCQCGHLLECHYPKTCEDADCDHHRAFSEGGL
jgi:hypothetical protein